MKRSMGRREVLRGGAAALITGSLSGCSLAVRGRSQPPTVTSRLTLAPLRASVDRITRITVCTRPFRAQGPRIELERVGSKNIVHNYGHGGSGWSLSWGSSTVAVQKAMETGEHEIGVIGCGALGLTSALLLQRAGARITIFAKELPPNVRSSLATGLWTPDSRICFEQYATPSFKQAWQDMARKSFDTYQTLVGLPGTPVEFIDSYFVGNTADDERRQAPPPDTRPQFAELQRELIGDLIPKSEEFAPGTHPLGQHFLRRSTLMMFNLTAYTHFLLAEFTSNGGRIEIAEFHTPQDLAPLPQKTLINATGYGARALFGDESITPVRGQLARVIPQPEVNYGLFYRGISFVPRRDGLVFQKVGDDDYFGFNDASTAPDPAEASLAVDTIAGLFSNASG
jgi:glycine/D-amino acid oxidase-like deaminating enzyme